VTDIPATATRSFNVRSLSTNQPSTRTSTTARMHSVGSLEKKLSLEEPPIPACTIASYFHQRTLTASLSFCSPDPEANTSRLPEKPFTAWIKTYIAKFGGDPNKLTVSPSGGSSRR